MDIREVSCPRCADSVSCDALLVSLRLLLHCPTCDVYFAAGERQAGPEMGRGPVLAGLSRVDAATVYIPAGAERWPAESSS